MSLAEARRISAFRLLRILRFHVSGLFTSGSTIEMGQPVWPELLTVSAMANLIFVKPNSMAFLTPRQTLGCHVLAWRSLALIPTVASDKNNGRYISSFETPQEP